MSSAHLNLRSLYFVQTFNKRQVDAELWEFAFGKRPAVKSERLTPNCGSSYVFRGVKL